MLVVCIALIKVMQFEDLTNTQHRYFVRYLDAQCIKLEIAINFSNGYWTYLVAHLTFSSPCPLRKIDQVESICSQCNFIALYIDFVFGLAL